MTRLRAAPRKKMRESRGVSNGLPGFDEGIPSNHQFCHRAARFTHIQVQAERQRGSSLVHSRAGFFRS